MASARSRLCRVVPHCPRGHHPDVCVSPLLPWLLCLLCASRQGSTGIIPAFAPLRPILSFLKKALAEARHSTPPPCPEDVKPKAHHNDRTTGQHHRRRCLTHPKPHPKRAQN